MLRIGDRRNVFYWQTDRNLSPEDLERYFLKRHEIATKDIVDAIQNGIASIEGIKSIEIIEPDKNVKSGNVNIVRKALINGQKYLVRIHPKGIKNEYFFVEQCALSEAKKEGLPVPQILEVHEARDKNDMDFVLMSVSIGITMENAILLNKELEHPLLRQLGAFMAKIHNIKVDKFGSFDNRVAKKEGRLVGLHSSYKDFIWCGLEENLQRIIGFKVVEKGQADALLDVFKTTNFEPIDGPRLIHNDLADWNVLVDGDNVSGLLDWDEAHGGDPVADLACWSTFFNIERFQTLLEGYKSVATLPDDYEKRFHFYRLRYSISKVALRTKRAIVDRSDFLQEKIKVGKRALFEELAWFETNSN